MFGRRFEVNNLKSWKHLEKCYKKFGKAEMREMFAKDPQRAEKYILKLGNMVFDYSKNRINDRIKNALLMLAKERKVDEKIEAMFAGEKINQTEKRAVLHVALRNRANTPIFVDGKNGIASMIVELRSG